MAGIARAVVPGFPHDVTQRGFRGHEPLTPDCAGRERNFRFMSPQFPRDRRLFSRVGLSQRSQMTERNDTDARPVRLWREARPCRRPCERAMEGRPLSWPNGRRKRPDAMKRLPSRGAADAQWRAMLPSSRRGRALRRTGPPFGMLRPCGAPQSQSPVLCVFVSLRETVSAVDFRFHRSLREAVSVVPCAFAPLREAVVAVHSALRNCCIAT